MTIKELLSEAAEIIRNAKRATDITPAQREEVIRQTLLDIGYQMEIINQPCKHGHEDWDDSPTAGIRRKEEIE